MGRVITKVKIKNFRQYHDIELDLILGKTNNLSVIVGNNRFGKTNLLNSLLWCLYGMDGIPSEENENNLAHFIKNERYPQEKTSVSITLEDKSNGAITIITREDESVSVTKKEASSKKFLPLNNADAEREVKSIISKNVKDLFLFKGEFLDNFFDEGGNRMLKDTIKNVSKIKRLEKMSEVLSALEISYIKEIERNNKNDGDINKLSKKLENYDYTIERVRDSITVSNSDIKERKKRIEEIDKSLRKLNQETINELMEREKDLIGQKDIFSEKIVRNKKLIPKMFLEDAAFWFLYDGMIDIHNQLDKLRKDGLIPPPIKIDLIKRILEERKCICGKSTDRDMEIELKKLIQKYPQNDKLEKIYEFNFFVDLDSSKFEKIYNRIKELIAETYDYENNLKNIKKKLDEITETLKGLDKETIYKFAAEKQLLQREIDEKGSDKAREEAELIALERDKKTSYDALQLHLTKSKKSESISRKLSQCVNFREKINKLSSSILNDISIELNSKTLQYFKDIFWENYQYINYKISINNEFDIEVKSPEDNDMLYLLSTGEKKVLALSFIAALSDFYGFDFPIIIDAPFTALQKEVTANMLSTLLTLSKRKQIIVLTIPHDDEVMKKLKDSANTIYHMDKDKNDNTLLKELKK